nr:hypothetical protein [Tanacetum cinerariifolium]
ARRGSARRTEDLLPRCLRPRHSGPGPGRKLPRQHLVAGRPLPLRPKQPHERGNEGAHHHQLHLHPAELCGGPLRHELSARRPARPQAAAQYARAVLGLGLPHSARHFGRHRGGAALLFLAQRLAE